MPDGGDLYDPSVYNGDAALLGSPASAAAAPAAPDYNAPGDAPTRQTRATGVHRVVTAFGLETV